MKRKWAIRSFLLVLLSSLAIGIAVSAAKIPDTLDTGRQCKLSIDAGEPAAGESMAIYRVGEISQDEDSLHFILTDDYMASGADITKQDSKTRSTAIQKLEEHAETRKPELTFDLNEYGRITLNVPMGVYLITDAKENDVDIQSGLISVPQVNDQLNNWSYEAELDLKSGVTTDIPKTGDSSHIFLLSFIVIFASCQLGLMLLAKKKLQRRSER